MYKEPRSLGIAQRAVTWAWEIGYGLLRNRHGDPLTAQMMAVAHAARALEISEFELFRRAFQAWHGCAPDTRELEREFGRYLNQQTALPFYVRRFVSHIAILAA